MGGWLIRWFLIHDPRLCREPFPPMSPSTPGWSIACPCHAQSDGKRQRRQQSYCKCFKHGAVSEHLVFYSRWTATRTRNKLHSWAEDRVHRSPSLLSTTKPGLGSPTHLVQAACRVGVTGSHRPSQCATPCYCWICYLSSQLAALERSSF